MKVGITGSRYGLSISQRIILVELFSTTRITEFHHGDCVGVDEEAVMISIEMGGAGVLHHHPATMNPEWDARWRANIPQRMPELGGIVYPARHPLARNKDIVDAADVIWAFPIKNSRGTWATVRYAKESGVRVEVYS